MEYEGQICRSPMERASFMLPVSVGCAYNQCYFCMLFKHLKYRETRYLRVLSLSFCAFGRRAETPKRFSWVTAVLFSFRQSGCCAFWSWCTGIFRLYGRQYGRYGPEHTGKDRQRAFGPGPAGVSHLYLGIESGLDDVLTLMNKGHTMAQACEAIERLKRAGMIYDAHMMTGVAGRGRGEENARAMALFYNRTGPGRIVNFSMFIHRDAPLYALIEQGRFTPADELENLREERLLLSQLTVPVDYDGFHDVIPFRVRGILPRDRDKMLRRLDAAIEAQREKEPLVAWA